MRSITSERGSIPLALLAVIVVAGLAATVLARTVAEDRSARFDRNYTVALHAADAGIEEAYFSLNNQLFATNATSIPPTSGSANGVPYEWTATRPDATSTSWTVTSESEAPDGTTRVLQATIAEEPLFDIAAFSMVSTSFNGNNGANSYDSALVTPGSCWTPGGHKPSGGAVTSPCTTGKGFVGSNGDLELGNNSYADGTFLFDWATPSKQYPNRCTQSNDPNGPLCTPPLRRNIDEPRRFDDELDDMEDVLDSTSAGIGCGTGASMPEWKTSTDGVDLGGGVYRMDLSPGVYCFAKLNFDKNTVLPSGVTAAAPLNIYVRDQVQVGGSLSVNCGGPGTSFPLCNDTNNSHPLDRPAARRLDIRLFGGDIPSAGPSHPAQPGVKIRNQAHFAGTILAPNATCDSAGGGPDIYGSVICRDIGNAGNWGFHFDEDLSNGATTGRFAVQQWTEQ